MTLKATKVRTKVRTYQAPDQTELLNRQFGDLRMAWNKALVINNHYCKVQKQNLSPKKDQNPLLAVAKKSRKYSWLKDAWLKDADSIVFQQSVINLDKVFHNFFNPKLDTRLPRFKFKHGKQVSYHCTCLSISDNWIKIPRCNPIKAKVHRGISGKLRSITLTRTTTGKFYASVLIEDDKPEAVVITDLQSNRIVEVEVEVEVGLTDIAITSSGVKTGNPRFVKNAQRNLKRKQKVLSHCKKGSKGRAKARFLVAKTHERVAFFARNDLQRKLSKQLVDENQAVIVETLNVKNMFKNQYFGQFFPSHSGGCGYIGYLLATQENTRPANKCQHYCSGLVPPVSSSQKTVRSIENHCLAKYIADAGWYSLICIRSFRRCLYFQRSVVLANIA